MRAFPIGVSAALLLAASRAAAQTAPTQTLIGFDVTTSAIDPIAADSAGVGHRAFGLQINGSIIAFRMLSLSAEGGIIGMSDEAAFTQETNQGEKTSGVAAGIGTLSAGVRTPPIALDGAKPVTFSAGLNAGHSFLHVTRTITNCADCHGEDVNIRAGSFWEPVVTVGFGPGAVSARYRTYLGGSDFNDALMVGYSIVPARRKPAPESQPPADAPPPAR